MRWTVRRKLTAGFLAVLLLLCCVSGVAFMRMGAMDREAQETLEQSMPKAMTIGNVKAHMLDIERLALRSVLEEQGHDEFQAEIERLVTKLTAEKAAYEELALTADESERWERILIYERQIATLLPSLVAAGESGDFEEVNALAEQLKQPMQEALTLLDEAYEASGAALAQAMLESEDAYFKGRMDVLLISLSAFAVGLIVAWRIARAIVDPVLRMEKAAKRIASGDLTVEPITVTNRDEIGDLASSFQRMIKHLRELLAEVNDSASRVASSASTVNGGAMRIRQATEQVSTTFEATAQGAVKQSKSAKETTTVIREMSAGVQQVAASASIAADAVIDAGEAADEGGRTLRDTTERMIAAQATVGRLVGAVTDLGERSLEIERFSGLVTSIASQTKLLALNASIEAARVGEQGSGFAVVAGEIRKLAEESAEAVREIKKVVGAIRDGAAAAAKTASSGTQEMADGMRAVRAAGEAFDRIQCSVRDVIHQIQELSAASQQMAAGTEQIVGAASSIATEAGAAETNMRGVSATVEHQFAATQDISSSAQRLADMSSELRGLVSRFQL
ncbi:methyl-accepting chemotaxis protein [Paenibacillus sp. TRM 82003]|nr:methyl-accepting chemotaxis protein [Paenibacillus sp. TRM 82003]